MLLAENDEGYKNLIKLVSSGYTEGFYYKPRIDKELLAQHSKGLIGLSSCLKGEVASALRVEQAAARRSKRRRGYRDILGPDNFFLEMQYQGIEEQKIVNRGMQPIAQRPRTCRSSPPTTRTTCGRRDSQAARHPAVHRHRQDGQRRTSGCATPATSST